MIICPVDYDWILAGDVYMAALIENEHNPESVKVVEVDFSGGVIKPITGINEELRISIIGHGSPGTYNEIIASSFIQKLHKMGLDENYQGTIEYYTCDSALNRNEGTDDSLAYLTKNKFKSARVIGAQGSSIIGYDKCRYIVDQSFESEASQLQSNLLNNHNFSEIINIDKSVFDKGKAVRDKKEVKTFYDNFIRQLKERNYLINGLSYLV